MGDPLPAEVVIETRNLTKDYGAFRAVEGLDLRVRRGEIYGFLGRNGAGKTTTIRMLLGLVTPTSGEIRLFGSPVGRGRTGALGRIGSLVETATAYPNLTVTENLEVHRRLSGAPPKAVDEVIGLLGLGEYRHRRADRLSLGNKQRLSLARALLPSPGLLVLDEPVNGLDPAGIAEVRALLRGLADRGTTVFLSSHLLDEVSQLADRLGLVHRGRLVEEIDRDDLHRLSRRAVEVEVDDPVGAEALLAGPLGLTGVSRVGSMVRVTDPAARPADLARALVGAGIGLDRLAPVEEDLERRFLRLTEGQ